MLEIIFLFFLVRTNRENADRTGKSTLLFTILSIALYYIFFIIGGVLGSFAGIELIGIYAFAFAMGLLGALISYILAKA